MIKSKFVLNKMSSQIVTQPNQAFTPRQILEQFARNELIPQVNSQSDLLTDDNYSDDQLLSDDVIEFEDDIEAQNHLIENQYRKYEEKQGSNNVRESPEGSSGETDSGGGRESPATDDVV